MARRLRILHVNDVAPGEGAGAEIYLGRLVAAQEAVGDTVHVVTGGGDKHGARRLLDLWDPAARRSVAEAAREFRPDIIHVHNFLRELSPSVLDAVPGVPVVVTVHDLRVFGHGEHHLPDPRAVGDRLLLSPLARRQIRHHASGVIAVSEAVADVVRAAGIGPVSVVGVPVLEPTASLRPPSQGADIVFAGRLSRDKGAHVLIDAFGQIATEFPSARLVLLGDGPQRDALTAQAAPLRSRIDFRGWCSPEDVSAAMATARAVVVPSLPGLRREGSSLAAAEAARHGRPVIGSNDPAVAEVVRAVGGEIVTSGDVRALARTLRRVLTEPAWADVLGQAALFAALDRYGCVSVTASVRETYLEVLRTSPTRIGVAA